MPKVIGTTQPGSSHLPSQRPRGNEEFERGYDKGVLLVADSVINLIDRGLDLSTIRHTMVEVRDASK